MAQSPHSTMEPKFESNSESWRDEYITASYNHHNKKSWSTMSKSMKYSIVLSVVLPLLIAFVIVNQAIKQAPTAQILVNPEGLNKLQYEQLDGLVRQQQVGSYFSANLLDIKKITGTLSWIDEVNVSRDWHQGIVVQALPRQPIARFGSEKLVDAKGNVYLPASEEMLTLYPLVTLQGDPEQAKVIMQQMQQVNEWFEPLGVSVEDIILTPRMTWLIRFDSGLRVLVDGENTAQKLMNVSQALQYQLSSKRHKIQSIDSRYKNGFAIAWKSS